MFKNVLFLLVAVITINVNAQQASVLGNCYYDNVNSRVVIRIAIRNNTGTATNCQIAAMRVGFQFNETVLNYSGYTSYFYNAGNTASGLNDAYFFAATTGDFDNEFGAVNNPYNDGTRTANIATGGTKTLRKNYFNRSTNQCDNLWIIPANTYRIAFDIYFTFKPGYTPAMYNLNTPGYGFGTPNFIAQFITSLNGTLSDNKKEIAVVIVTAGQNPYQPFDQSGSDCQNGNVNPVAITNSDVSFINPISGLLAGKIEQSSATDKNTHVDVEWTVANNDIVDHYEIERKEADGNFKTIGLILSDNLTATKNYSYKDKITGSQGELYYRVKAVNKDGLEDAGPIMRVNIKDVQNEEIKILPNPATSFIQLQLPVINGSYLCRVYNMSGRLVLVSQAPASAAKLNIDQLSRGNYFMEAFHPQTGKRYYGKFSRQ